MGWPWCPKAIFSASVERRLRSWLEFPEYASG
jgi:hypothetical protein